MDSFKFDYCIQNNQAWQRYDQASGLSIAGADVAELGPFPFVVTLLTFGLFVCRDLWRVSAAFCPDSWISAGRFPFSSGLHG